MFKLYRPLYNNSVHDVIYKDIYNLEHYLCNIQDKMPSDNNSSSTSYYKEGILS